MVLLLPKLTLKLTNLFINITFLVSEQEHSKSSTHHTCAYQSAPNSQPFPTMQELCDLKVRINDQQTFHLHQSVLCSFSGRLKRMVKEEKKKMKTKSQDGIQLKLMEFPGGPAGFELASRFCYNNGSIGLTPSNICLLHCSALVLEMTEEVSKTNLLGRTEAFLEGAFQWPWSETLAAVKSSESFHLTADFCSLFHRLISCLLAKISANSELSLLSTAAFPSSSSYSCSSSSSSSSSSTPEPMRPCVAGEWWFDDLTVLGPSTVERIMSVLGAYGVDNRNLILTRFLLHYLKGAAQRPSCGGKEYAGLADTAVNGVIAVGRAGFSCRGLFWVLRVVSELGLSRGSRQKLEAAMGAVLDRATLDDLLVSGHGGGGVYDVNLVLRLVRVYVGSQGDLQRMIKVGRLVDKYLGEISPDQSLKVAKFLEVAESLPDSARDCFDGVYRAVDIYLQSHPTLSAEERTRLCCCLNYEKLSLEACKDLAKNRKIPPAVAVQALVSQQSKLQIGTAADKLDPTQRPRSVASAATAAEEVEDSPAAELGEKEQLRLNLQRMENRVKELEKVCRSMKGQMSKIVKSKSMNQTCRGLPRLC